MYTCAKGHSSASADYCDECGAPIGSARPSTQSQPSATGSTPAASGSTGDSGSGAASGSVESGQSCPDCGTPRDGRFCEVCGRDFLAVPQEAQATAPGSSPASVPPVSVSPGPVPVPPGPVAAPSSAPAGLSSAAMPASPGSTAAPGPGTPPVAGWRVVVAADRAYYERMRAGSGPDAPEVAFPVFCPERRFTLSGDQVLVGRRSRSRGIEPPIDLTGPPEDVGVSHTHALLVRGADGGWSIVDLDSANGTYLNESADPLPANTPTPLAAGDRVHVGAWTTLTVSAG
jgi:hypothetical protein